MIKTIIAFLLKERYLKNLFKYKKLKVLKNKKGFSLLEVLIAVAIIGIIGTIAVPQFNAQRENAAQVAADTSATNIVKAFQVCMALKPFGECDTMGEIKVTCPGNTVCAAGGTSPNFCAHIKRGTAGSEDFNVCVSVNSSTGNVTRTYGGKLLGKKKCVTTCGAPASGVASCTSGSKTVETGTCTDNTACTGHNVTAAHDVSSKTSVCEIPSTAGNCDSTAGTCS